MGDDAHHQFYGITQRGRLYQARRDFLRVAGAGWAAPALAAARNKLSFQPAGNGEFDFDTGVMRGKLRPGGKAWGITQLVHVPTGAPVTRAESYRWGLLTHYRVFTENRRYGGAAWDWPSEATLANGAVEVHWPAGDRPFEMWATYRWAAADTLDLETRVKAHQPLKSFESFLSSYFPPAFTNALVYAKGANGAAFVAAEASEGAWQLFPRGDSVMAMIDDGRWAIPPSPMKWVKRGPLEAPLAMRRDPSTGLTAILMAAPKDCFAVALPQQREDHFAIYLSLFGRTLDAGETAEARTRLVVARVTEKQAVKLYRKWATRKAHQ